MVGCLRSAGASCSPYAAEPSWGLFWNLPTWWSFCRCVEYRTKGLWQFPVKFPRKAWQSVQVKAPSGRGLGELWRHDVHLWSTALSPPHAGQAALGFRVRSVGFRSVFAPFDPFYFPVSPFGNENVYLVFILCS